MSADSVDVGRIIYSALEITGAVISLFITINLIRRLFFDDTLSKKERTSSTASTSSQPTKQLNEPTMHMKICSVACGALLCVGFVLKSLLISSVINQEIAPDLVVQAFYHIGNVIMDGGQALYFKYFLLSIRKLYRTNDTARAGISKPMLISTEVMIIVNISASIIYTLCILSIFHSTKIDESVKDLVAIIYTVANLVFSCCINILLVYLYGSIMSSYAGNWNFDGSEIVTDQHHLLLLLMTRYCSLIIISATINILSSVYVTFEIFAGDYFAKDQAYWTIIGGAVELVDVSAYIIIIFFSFSINNLLYEKYCFCCHNIVYGAAHKIVAKKRLASTDYVMMTDQEYSDNGDMIKHQNSSILMDDDLHSNTSSRRGTNYFDDNMYVSP